MEKRIKNSSGEILIRQTSTGEVLHGPGIVEMMHLYNKNESGCVIGYWEVRKSDDHDIAEFQSVHDRIINIEYDDPQILLDALKFGQKLADLLIETGNYKKNG